MSHTRSFPSITQSKRLSFTAILAFLAVGGSITVTSLHQWNIERKQSVVAARPNLIQSSQVHALGRIEPQGETIQLSAPIAHQRLKQWLVQEGDLVEARQVIAVMHGIDQATAAVNNAQSVVEIARANLTKVQAGTPLGRIEAQREHIETLRAQQLGDIGIQQVVIS